jgi:hypothetical protein
VCHLAVESSNWLRRGPDHVRWLLFPVLLQTGLSSYSRNRRMPGLRRSEVADLAGVSVEYYAQHERGNLGGVSESVLDALACAPRLGGTATSLPLCLIAASRPYGI